MENQSSIEESLTDLFKQIDELGTHRVTRKLFELPQSNRIKPKFRPSLIDRATRKLPNFSTPMPNHDMRKSCSGFPADISYIGASNTTNRSHSKDDGSASIENNNNIEQHDEKTKNRLKGVEEKEVGKTRNNGSRRGLLAGEKSTPSKKNSRLDRTNAVNKTRKSRIVSSDEEFDGDELERPWENKSVLADAENLPNEIDKSDILSEHREEVEKSTNDKDVSKPQNARKKNKSRVAANKSSKIGESRIPSEDREEFEKSKNGTRNISRSRKIMESSEDDSDDANLKSPLKNNRSIHLNKNEKSRIPSEDREEVEKSTNRTRNNRSRSRVNLKLDECDKDVSKPQSATKKNKSQVAANKSSKMEESRIPSKDREEVEKSTNCTRNNRSRLRVNLKLDECDKDVLKPQSATNKNKSRVAANKSSKIEESCIPSEDREEVEKSTNRSRNNRSRLRVNLKLEDCDKDVSKPQSATKKNKSRVAANKSSKMEESRIPSETQGEVEKSSNPTRHISRARKIPESSNDDSDDPNLESPSKKKKSIHNKIEKSCNPSEDREEVEKSANRTRNNRSRSRVNLKLDECNKDVSKPQNATKKNKSRAAANKSSKIEESRIPSEGQGEVENFLNPTCNISRSRKILESSDDDSDDANLESPSKKKKSIHYNKIEKSCGLSEDREEVEKSTNRTRNNRSRSRVNLKLDDCDKDVSKPQNATKKNKNPVAANKSSKIEENRILSEGQGDVEKSSNSTRDISRSRKILESSDDHSDSEKSTNFTRNNRSASRENLDLDECKDVSKLQNLTKNNKSRIIANKSHQIEKSFITNDDQEEEKSTNYTQNNRSLSRTKLKFDDADLPHGSSDSPQFNSSNTRANKLNKSTAAANKKKLMSSIGINTTDHLHAESIVEEPSSPNDKKLTRSFGTNTTAFTASKENDETTKRTNTDILKHSMACQVDDLLETTQVESSNKRSLDKVLARLHAEKNHPPRKSILKAAADENAVDNQRMVTFSETATSSGNSSTKRLATSTPNNISIKRKARDDDQDETQDDSMRQPWRFDASLMQLPRNDLTWKANAAVKTKTAKSMKTFASKKTEELKDSDVPSSASEDDEEKEDTLLSFNEFVVVNKSPDKKSSDQSNNLNLLQSSNKSVKSAANSSVTEDQHVTFNSHKGSKLLNPRDKSTSPQKSPVKKSQKQNSRYGKDIDISGVAEFDSGTPESITNVIIHSNQILTDINNDVENRSTSKKSKNRKEMVDIEDQPVDENLDEVLAAEQPDHQRVQGNDGFLVPELPDKPVRKQKKQSTSKTLEENESSLLTSTASESTLTSESGVRRSGRSRRPAKPKMVGFFHLTARQAERDLQSASTLLNITKPRLSKTNSILFRKTTSTIQLEVIPENVPTSSLNSSPGEEVANLVEELPPTPAESREMQKNVESVLPAKRKRGRPRKAAISTVTTVLRKNTSSNLLTVEEVPNLEEEIPPAPAESTEMRENTASVMTAKKKRGRPSKSIPTVTSVLKKNTSSNLSSEEEMRFPVEELPASSENTDTEESVDPTKGKKGRLSKKKESKVLSGRVTKKNSILSLSSMNSTVIELMDGTKKRVINWVGSRMRSTLGDSDTLASIGFEHPITHSGIGVLEIQPGKSKKLITAKKFSMYFYVIRGEAEVQVGDSSSVVRDDDTFYVPKGFPYCINNCSETNPLKLNFYRTIEEHM